MEDFYDMRVTLQLSRLSRKLRGPVDASEPLSKLILQARDGELKWALLYSAVTFESEDSLSRHLNECSIRDLHLAFKLLPLSGRNFFKTTSYSLDLLPGSLSINSCIAALLIPGLGTAFISF